MVDVVVGNAVLVLKHLIQTHSKSSTKCSDISLHSPQSIVSFLARRVDNIRHSPAKACVIWLVGQYSVSNTPEDSLAERGVEGWVPDVLRKSTKSFRQEVNAWPHTLIDVIQMMYFLDTVGEASNC
jgi:AP-3 complex subunit beta